MSDNYYIYTMPLPELELVARLRRQARRAEPGPNRAGAVLVGIGDDCAILRGDSRQDLLATTDLSIEGIHFRRAWHPPVSVGHRALARGLSDIAAMGGAPATAFLSLGLPRDTPQAWVDGFMRGFLRLARRFGVALAGGDTGESRRGIVADVVVLGHVPRGRAILRSGARPGDAIYVTGRLGASAATLRRLFAGEHANPAALAQAAHFFPEPRLEAAVEICRRRLASAMIDLSDGLSTDLAHICEASGVAAVLYEEQAAAACADGAQPTEALHGGEDYELVFTAPANRHMPRSIAGVRVSRIGEVVERKRQPYRIALMDPGGRKKQLFARGWQHFRKRA